MQRSRFLVLLLALACLFAVPALRAQDSEPTVHQIYQAANGGDLPRARAMIDQVLQRHPRSARAHYVKAELAARANDAATARSELQQAEQLDPGLPFARPEAVSALRSQLDRLSAPAPAQRPAPRPSRRTPDNAPPTAAAGAAATGGVPWGALVLVAAVVIGGMLLLRRRRAEPPAPAPFPSSPYARDDAFGRAPPPWPPQPGMDGMGPGPYAAPQPPVQGGMGSALARGLGTGLAIGAGAVAAQEIGRRMFEHGHEQDHRGPAPPADPGHPAVDSPLAHDAGLDALGGAPQPGLADEDFGIRGAGGWDDAGAGLEDLGGDDWDR